MLRNSSLLFLASIVFGSVVGGCGGDSDTDGGPSNPDAAAQIDNDAGPDSAPEAAEVDSDAPESPDANEASTPEVPTCTATPEVEAFWNAYAQALCEGFAGCCDTASLSYDTASCVAAVSTWTLETVARSCVTFDAAAADKCLQETKQVASACEAPPNSWELMLANCAGAVAGTVAPGEWCNWNTDCAEPTGGAAYCHVSSEGNRCIAVKIEKEIGASCDPTGDPEERHCDLRAGLYCNLETSMCEPLGEVGEPCTQTFSSLPSCVEGAACSSQNLCEALGQPGEACGYEHVPCIRGAHCDAATNVCVAYKAIGESCAQDADCGESDDRACVGETCQPISPWLLFTPAQTSCDAAP